MPKNVYSDLSIKGLGEVYTLMIESNQKVQGPLLEEINNRGGEEQFRVLLTRQKVLETEKERIKKEAAGLMSDSTDSDFLKTMIHSDILSKEELSDHLESVARSVGAERTNKKIDADTLSKSLLGLLIGIFFGAILTFIQIIFTGSFMYLSLVLIFIASSVSMRVCTKKNLGNTVVFIFTIIATILGPVAGFLIAKLFSF